MSSYEQDARQRLAALSDTDLDLDVMTAVFDLFRATGRLLQDFEATVHRPAGLTWAGFRVLFSLWVRPDSSPADLARRAGVSRPTVSSVLNTLERNGFVTRSPSPADGRQVTVALTTRGAEQVAEAFRRQHRRERAWLADLPAEQRSVLIAALRHLLTVPPPPADG